MVKNITIFTTNTCGYCKMVKQFLTNKGINYDEINLDNEPEKQKEAFELSGQLTVPITLITKSDDSKQVVVGYNLAQLVPAIS
ncbi:MAG TPA: glutaredoxin family protein [Candidatus Dormibacteraeota bacterium]|nr:glutaredoxin family protein [Candidatus Dormibacteraeota bacterium]